MVVVAWCLWRGGCGVVFVAWWLWRGGCGVVVVAWWLWRGGCGVMVVAWWLSFLSFIESSSAFNVACAHLEAPFK